MKVQSLIAGTVMALGASVAAAQDLQTVAGVDAEAMNVSEMQQVVGQGHGGASNLGALLAANSALAGEMGVGLRTTPAWGSGGTLNPGTEDGALLGANVNDAAVN